MTTTNTANIVNTAKIADTSTSATDLANHEPAPARHWVGLRDVTEVETPQFRESQAQLARVVKAGGIAAISGRPGSGKTFSVDYFLQHHPQMAGRQHVWVDISRKPTVKGLTLLLSKELGLNPKPRDAEYVLVEDLIDHMRDLDIVVCLDEAQNLSVDALQQLRYFHDRCAPTRPGQPNGWSLLLVGSTVDKKLASASELDSRVHAWVRFEPLAAADLLLALRAWHPLLAEMDPELLLRIDRQQCRGNWRHWAQFLGAYIHAHGLRPATNHDDRQKLAALAIRSINRRPR